MNRKLFILILTLHRLICDISGQAPPEELDRIKSNLRQAQTDSARFTAYYELSKAYRFFNIDTAHYYADQSLALSRTMKDPAREARALSEKGFFFLETGDIGESLEYQLAALRLSEHFSNPEIESFTLNRIGNVYLELGDYKKAVDYYRMARDQFAKINFTGYVFNELSNIGNAYELMGLLDSGRIYQQQVYQYSLTNKDRYAITYGEMRQRLGKIESRLGNYDAALLHYRAGIAETFKDVDRSNLAVIYVQMASVFKHLKLYDSSFAYAKRSIETANGMATKPTIYEASSLLVSLFKLKNQPDSALAYAELSAATRDSIYGYKKLHAMQRLFLREQERQQQLQEEKNQLRQRYRTTALVTVLGLVLISGIILFRNNRQKHKANKVLEITLRNLKATQSQLIQAEKMASLGELTAGIAHEIQNPLNFVNNFSEVNTELLEELKNQKSTVQTDGIHQIDEELIDSIIENEKKINHHGKRADAIVKGMLQHSRSGGGRREPTSIHELADEYLRLAYHGLRGKDKTFNSTITTHFDKTIEKVDIVPQDIGRVLLNLYNNAFYAVHEKKKTGNANYEPTVTISTRKAGAVFEISVKDNGTGIPEKITDKIFQPFFTTKPTGQGTGLGLSLSYDIIKAHGGELIMHTNEGIGSEFIIRLPGNT